MRILVSAYACEPRKGSEPGVGWNWVCQIARFHDTWVLTRANNRSHIEAALADRQMPNVHFIYTDLPKWASFWKRGARGLRLYYYMWQIRAAFVANRLHRLIGFDVAHHVTFVNYWLPSFLPMLPVPFVLGPVGGGEAAPRSFRRSFSIRGRGYDVLRQAAKSLAHVDPIVRFAARRAAVALATTPETADSLLRLGCNNVSVLSQVALSTEELRSLPGPPCYRASGPFRILSVGRLLHWKGFQLGLRAFAEFKKVFPDSEYRIIGDGPELTRLEKLARTLGVGDAVRFIGRMTREHVMHAMMESDVLLNPSLHDSGSYVCAEAMAIGIPVLCLDTGGPALLVTDDTGIKIEALTPAQVVHDLSTAMKQLAEDPLSRERLGTSARSRARNVLAWDAKGNVINSIYEQIAATEIQKSAKGRDFSGHKHG